MPPNRRCHGCRAASASRSLYADIVYTLIMLNTYIYIYAYIYIYIYIYIYTKQTLDLSAGTSAAVRVSPYADGPTVADRLYTMCVMLS